MLMVMVHNLFLGVSPVLLLAGAHYPRSPAPRRLSSISPSCHQVVPEATGARSPPRSGHMRQYVRVFIPCSHSFADRFMVRTENGPVLQSLVSKEWHSSALVSKFDTTPTSMMADESSADPLIPLLHHLSHLLKLSKHVEVVFTPFPPNHAIQWPSTISTIRQLGGVPMLRIHGEKCVCKWSPSR